MFFLVALLVSVWEALANLVRKVPDFCAWGLRHLVFKTNWIALGYLEYNGFRQLQRYPLQLTQGDVEENITDLLATVETLDSETEKIKVCASVDRVQAIDGVQMMAHMACSTGFRKKDMAQEQFCESNIHELKPHCFGCSPSST